MDQASVLVSAGHTGTPWPGARHEYVEGINEGGVLCEIVPQMLLDQ
jgi:hypothetical protein